MRRQLDRLWLIVVFLLALFLGYWMVLGMLALISWMTLAGGN